MEHVSRDVPDPKDPIDPKDWYGAWCRNILMTQHLICQTTFFMPHGVRPTPVFMTCTTFILNLPQIIKIHFICRVLYILTTIKYQEGMCSNNEVKMNTVWSETFAHSHMQLLAQWTHPLRLVCLNSCFRGSLCMLSICLNNKTLEDCTGNYSQSSSKGNYLSMLHSVLVNWMAQEHLLEKWQGGQKYLAFNLIYTTMTVKLADNDEHLS